MPILGLGVHVLIAIFFAIHALRSGRELYWLFILFMFPLLGSIVYAAVVWLPEMRNSRGTQRIVRGIRQSLNPGAELREAQAEFDLSSTVGNRLRLADALVGHGRAADAIAMYRDCLRGVYHDDPQIEVKLARALLESGDAAAARATLDALIVREPDFKSPEGHLLYARAVAACGDHERAKVEFDALMKYASGLEVPAYYAEALAGWGDTDAARALCEDALKHVHRMSAHARQLNDVWIRRLRQIAAR